MSIRFIRLNKTEPEIAELIQLTLLNMQPYYLRHSMTWNATQLWQQIRQEHILAIELADQRVGYIRYHVIDNYLYLSDLQLHSTRVGQGIGSRAIQFLSSMTKKLCLHGIRLRVFVDSPAIGLYERFGFVCVGEEVSLLKYEWRLVASDLHAIPPQSYQ